MSPRSLLHEARKLPTAQRISLVGDIWNSIAQEQAEVPLSPAQKRQLDRRARQLETNPEIGLTWQQIKKSLRPKARAAK